MDLMGLLIQDKNYIEQYYDLIKSGEITVGDKVRRVYKKLVADIHDSKSEWEYDNSRAEHAITFIEKYCKIIT